jgi:hypothetical protein
MQLLYLTSDGKVIMNSSGLVYLNGEASLPTSYDYRGEEDGESTEIDLGNNKVVVLTYESGNEHPHTFSADFSLAVVTDDPSEHDYELVHWGSYSLSEYYMQKTIYLYDLGDTYSFPTGSDGTPAGEYIYAKYTPLARLS